jgi:hypothetical protein
MNESLLLVIVAMVVIGLALSALAWLWLWREQKKLRQDFRTLTTQLQRSHDDVAGLCSAAVAVDKRLALNESRLNNMLDSTKPEPQPRSSAAPAYQEMTENEEEQEQQGYELAIDKIRRGANVDELVKSCGLTRDEAVLLVRLHGR